MRNTLLIVFSLWAAAVVAQPDTKSQIRAAFEKDSFHIGEHIQYILSVKYPKNQIAIVPDSVFNYYPFEYIDKKYIPTRTDSVFAYDSIVYILASYEVIPTQFLLVPVKFIVHADTLQAFTATDSIVLQRLVGIHSEKDVIADARLTDTPESFNYPYIIAISGSALVLIYILYKIFGRFILIRYRLFILKRTHNRFIKEYDLLAEQFEKSTDLRIIEQTLAIWKNYLTRLENTPINTYTTKELIHLYDQEELDSTLQSLDRNVYGGMVTKDTTDALQTIKKFTNRRFQLRRRMITGG